VTEVYGTAGNPGAPGTWQRDVWWALIRTARVGAPTGRSRWKPAPPFVTSWAGRTLRVTDGEPRLPFGRGTKDTAWLTHIPRTVLFAWHRGVLAGRAVAWWCGARTAYFRLIEEPESALCPNCVVRMTRGA